MIDINSMVETGQALGIGQEQVDTEFITGVAGSGKTFMQLQRIEEDPKYALLCATTGIAAVNLGTATVNSLLKYFDTDSLRDKYQTGALHRVLRRTFEEFCSLVIDEASMLDGEQLDLIVQASDEVFSNDVFQRERRFDDPPRIILTGDHCQLPPIKAKWSFEADCWPRFEKNTVRLTKIWRQDNPKFLEALNAARRGDGERAGELLRDLVRWEKEVSFTGDATTIMAKNDQVDRYNKVRLGMLDGDPFILKRLEWGRRSGEWRNIPERLQLKVGALVMILANDSPEFTYANGDLGIVDGIPERDEARYIRGQPAVVVPIRLLRNDCLVMIPIIERLNTTSSVGSKDGIETYRVEKSEGLGRPQEVHYDPILKRYVMGAVKFFPLRLAYATTLHKAQGLSLDRVQMDVRDGFFAQPGMVYVGLSRARTPEGLTIIGTPEMLAKRITTDPKVERWL